MDHCDLSTEIWQVRNDFEQQEFYQFYDRLINSERLLSGLQTCGYTLQFLPHPNLQPHISRFHHDERVKFIGMEVSYRDVFAESRLIVTDYSSTVFDFAYLRKPVIYSQFDGQRIFSEKHMYDKGYFDYQRDGFGEITVDLDTTIDLILEYVRNGCQLKDLYRERIDRFFAFSDMNNCKRVTEKILEMSKTM